MQTDTQSNSNQETPQPPETPTDNGGSVTQLELTIVNPAKGVLTPVFSFDRKTGDITIRENLSYDEWKEGLEHFKWAQTHLKLGFAKYLKFGEIKFGKTNVESALHQLEFNLPNVTQAIAINSIPEDLRYENLQAEHYVVLARANIIKALQAKWAKTASEQGLTPVQLKASIEIGEVVTEATAKKNTHGIISLHGIAQEYRIWKERVKGVKGIKKMKPEEIAEIIELHKDFVETYNELLKPPKIHKAKSPKRAPA